MAATKKNLNASLDDLLVGLDLPSDAEINQETGRLKNSIANSGARNAMYGKSAYTNMPEDEKRRVANKKRTTLKSSEEKQKEHAKKSARHGTANGMYGKGELISGERNGFYGKTHKDTVKQTLSDKAKNRTKDKTCEHCGKVVDAQTYGTHHGKYCHMNPNQTKRKTATGPRPQEVETCEHCKMEGGKGMMGRYHHDNCFMKGSYVQSYIDGKKHKVYKTHKQIVDDGILFDRVKLCCLGKKKSVNGVVYKLVKR